MKFPLVLIHLVLAIGVAHATPEFTTPRPNPERFRNQITEFENVPAETGGIVFTGSSSIRLWSTLKEDFSGLPVINRGFGGTVSNDLIVFFDALITRHQPKLVVVYCGTNDLAEKLTVDEALADYTKFLEMIHAQLPETRVIVTSVKIAESRLAQIPQVHALNRELTAWCAERDWTRFVDCTSYLADPQGAPIPVYFRADNLHLSPAGYAKWREILEPVVREEWEKVK